MGSFWISKGNNQEGKQKTQNMCLTATTSRGGKVAQTVLSTTSEWELGREIWAASTVLRIRTGPECPEDNMRELMWDSNPNCRMIRETENKQTKNFPKKGSNAPWCTLACSQNKGMNTKGEQVGCHIGPSVPRGREAGMQQPDPEGKGLLQSQPQRRHLPPNCEEAPSC